MLYKDYKIATSNQNAAHYRTFMRCAK